MAGGSRTVRSLACRPFMHVVILAVLVGLLEGEPAPSINEYLYLLLPYKQSDSGYLLNDWTLSRPWSTHLIFTTLLTPLTAVLAPPALAWLGRLACWIVNLTAIWQLAGHFRIPPWMVTLSVSLWLAYGQSVVGRDWVVGGFEGKSIAYALLFFALTAFVRGRDLRGGVLLGLAFSVHPAVGVWGGLATGGALALVGRSRRVLATTGGLAFLFALPGLIPLLTAMATAGGGSSADDWRFLALVRMPQHLDPLWWPQRDILLLYLLLLFNWLHVRANPADAGLRLLLAVQALLAMVFTAGFALRLLEQFALLSYMPFRLFPVLTLLLFFFHLMSAYRHRTAAPPPGPLVLAGLFALMSLGNPFGAAVDRVRGTASRWIAPVDDLHRAFDWLAGHTANGSVAILPPWRPDAWYVARRAHVANWQAVPYDRLTEWRARMGALVGELPPPRRVLDSTPELMESRFNGLSQASIEAIAARFGGDYLVSRARYPYPVLFDSGTYRVYRVEPSRMARP